MTDGTRNRNPWLRFGTAVVVALFCVGIAAPVFAQGQYQFSQRNLKKIQKAIKKEHCCNGTVLKDEESGQEVLQFQGDQRDAVKTFLIKEEISDKESIKAAVARKEGCRLRGNVVLEKVSGRIHISCNALIIELLIQAFDGLRNVNTSHTIHEFAFGEPYPGSINPLDRYNRITEEPGSFKYFLKVVPTEYVHLNGTVVHTFQYSVTEYYSKFGSDEMMLPGIHFKYDMSAIAVKLRERKTSFLHFLTRLCATIGGAFALTSLANSWVYRITSKFS